MKTVKPLSMGFCLECHRNPENHLRPVEFVTDLAWQPPGKDAAERQENQRQMGLEIGEVGKVMHAHPGDRRPRPA